ncbi:MAG: ATP-binding protein [Archangium sp.]|nr:ATP-binding protein [Archangium sp.]
MNDAFSQFLHVLPEPSALVRGSGEIVKVNSALAELLGVAPASLAGGSLTEFVTDGPARVTDYLRLCSRSRQLVPGAFNWRRPGGAPVETRCDGTVLVPAAPTEPALLFICCRPKAEATDHFGLLNQKIEALSHEIIERRKLQQQRDELFQSEKAARLDAEKNSRMKDEFLATLSHELRTPLNSIMGWSQILKRVRDPETVDKGIAVIERNAQLQKQLIEDLLDMSRIISGKVRLDVQLVDLAAVIEAALQSVQPAADAKNIRLQATLDRMTNPVKGDPSRLQQIVWNLVSNAIKFTPKGGRVQVVLERVNSHVEISVSDTGEGIKPEFLPHVFDRFRQADESTTRRHGGLGLGLSIVKQLTELHGGSVRAASPGERQGATFVVMLPVLVLHAEPQGPERPPVEHPALPRAKGGFLEGVSLQGVSVLVVDDEPDARDLVKRFLEGCEATVITAGSAAEGLDALTRHRPQVIVSDIGMPGVDGYQFIKNVRSLPKDRGARTPALALTAFARTEDRTRALHAGFNLHLSKPIDGQELVAIIGSLSGRIGGAGEGD